MEEKKFSKPVQRYRDRRVEQRRFYKNKKENITSSESEGARQKPSRVNWVKPTYGVVQEDDSKSKSNNVKENIVSTDQNKSRKRNSQVQEEKGSYKPANDQAAYNVVPRADARPFRANYNHGQNQSKTKISSGIQSKHVGEQERKQHDDTVAQFVKPAVHVGEQERKQHDDTVAQFAKPAVHVQPIQQVEPELNSKGSCRTGQDQIIVFDQSNVLSDHSNLHMQHLLHERTNQGAAANIGRNNRPLNNKYKGEQSRQSATECFANSSPRRTEKTGEEEQVPLDHTANTNQFINEAPSADHHPTTNDAECNIQLPYKRPQHSTLHKNQPTMQSREHDSCIAMMNSEQALAKDRRNINLKDEGLAQENYNSQLSGTERSHAVLPSCQEPAIAASYCDKNYGYRISVDSLFSTSFFDHSQTTKQQDENISCDKLSKDFITEMPIVRNEPPMKDEYVQRNETPEVCHEPTIKKNYVNRSEMPCAMSVKTSLTDEQPAPQYNQTLTSVDPTKPHFLSSQMTSSFTDSNPDQEYTDKLGSGTSAQLIHSSHLAPSDLPPLNARKSDHFSNILNAKAEYSAELATEHTASETQSYKPFSGHVEHSLLSVDTKLALFPSVEDTKSEVPQGKGISQQGNPANSVKESEKQNDNVKVALGTQPGSTTYTGIPSSCSELQMNESEAVQYEAQQAPTSSINSKQCFDKVHDVPNDDTNAQVPCATFSQAPFLPNPFFNHSLLTHRAIPSAFVYPSRVGLTGTHSAFPDVPQHSATTPSPHLFSAAGTTACLNVGGRLFEVLPSTFFSFPESLLYQIFTGTTSPSINQKGQVFFDRDGYLFEIILTFARCGQLTLPPRVSLTALINEAKYFGMYDYMFQQGQVPRGSPFQFQRTTCCTLSFDGASNTSETKVFVLQGEDKLKIESVKASGPCHLYVDLYTPSGIKETSNFLLYSPEKPELWKAYQLCAERQLVFHLGQQGHDKGNPSLCVVFAQTFVFHGDEFVP